MSNRLKDERSPYLLQHKDNPVDWYPWGEEAFGRARREDRPIFLSIGYATCHWCHVMEHESFEDEEVARLMNEAFVCIKVDREERPDVDGVYMTVCQMMTGHGGWPLTILMTPEKEPFYAATYLPRASRFGRLGMLELVPRVAELWRTEREHIFETAAHVTASLRSAAAQAPGAQPLGTAELADAYQHLAQRFDPVHGGFGDAPKFPSPHNLLFLLRYWKRSGERQALEMVAHTLRRMRLGGVYDHVGFGFHRYATDRTWLLPHFEKMLYDQALLVMAYVEAYLATGDRAFEQTAREVLSYVLRDMTAPEGGFYSAEDADSEGREGKFYVWEAPELDAVLSADDARLARAVFNVEADGNFAEEATRRKTGENVLYLAEPLATLAGAKGLPEDELAARLEAIRRTLFDHRERRIHPLKDDKILTDWNGLMIAALARAARAFDEPAYADAATRAVHFVAERLTLPDGRLLHRYRDGDAAVPGNLDDYAFLTWGLLDLYETTFDPSLLERALVLDEHLQRRFRDPDAGGFFFTADDAEGLIVRQKEFYDGAVPSGNSVAMLNLLRLGRMTGSARFEERAVEVGRAAGDVVRRMPAGFTALLMGLDFAVGPTAEIVIAGEPGAADTRAMLKVLGERFDPNRVVLLRPRSGGEAMTKIAPFVEAMQARGGRATAYVCRDYRCEAPVDTPEALRARLDAGEGEFEAK